MSIAPAATSVSRTTASRKGVMASRVATPNTWFGSANELKATSFFGATASLGATRQATPMGASRRSLQVQAGKLIEVEVEKPLGVNIAAKKPYGVVIKSVKGNGAKAGLKAGDNIIYTSSFFGDELWPADQLGFTRSAINACPNSVWFVVERGDLTKDVKRLPKKPAPARFGRKLSGAQKERASHICLDCGFIYSLAKPFAEQGADFECPQCAAPRRRFAKYDAETGKVSGGSAVPIDALVAFGVSIALIAGLAYVAYN